MRSDFSLNTKTVFKRTPSLLKIGAHFQKHVDLARFLKITFLRMGRFQAHKMGFFLEIRSKLDFRFQKSWISVPKDMVLLHCFWLVSVVVCSTMFLFVEFCFIWGPWMAINASVQYNGGLLAHRRHYTL